MDNKTKKIATVPEGYTNVIPWVISKSTAELINFLKDVFEAEEVPNSRITNEDGVIIHSVVQIGNAKLMLFDSREGWPATPSFLNFYVDDIEDAYNKSIKLGAKSVTDITLLWFGDKVCRILDPFGNLFWINQRIEEVDFTNPVEIKKLSSTPEAVKGIEYFQKTLDEALKIQKRLFQIDA